MLKILKNLKECKLTVAMIFVLLVIQAYCDLALPQYTADIVDVGIGQGGIESSVPERMRAETYAYLKLLLTEQENDMLEAAYETDTEGNYVLVQKDEEALALLDAAMRIPVIMISSVADSEKKMDLSSAEMPSREQLQSMRRQVEESFGDMSESIISQRAVLAVQSEYTALGMDLEKVQTTYLWATGAKMLGMSVIMMAAAILAGLLASKTAAKVGMNLRNKVFKKVVSFSGAELDRFSTASLITRSTNDIQQVQMVTVMLLRIVMYAPILGIGGVIKVATTRTGMSWIIGVAVGVIILVVAVLMNIAMPKFKKMQTLIDRLNLVSREILTGIPVIRAFSREKHEEERFEGANQDLMKTQLFTNRTMTFMMPVMMLIMNGITVLIVWVGAQGIDLGNLQVGDMLAFITYTMQIVMSFLMITMISVMLPRAGVAAGRIEEVIDTSATIHDPENPADDQLKNALGEVSFHDVSFRYPGADEDALEHLSFTAKPGQTTAIIGSTGCGKSTLLHLIPRFYDVTGGSITIDGIDIRSISQHKLRSLLGFVPQKGVLFSGDIASNIKFGGETIPDEQMKEAAEIAQAAEFIESKREQYESPISQGGTNVSGGQKQRLSIARAIAKNPKIFLFDDSFSALDYKTDIVLRKALNEKVKDAAVIIVAQRISTILHADQIIVLDDGKINGIGTHEELLKNCETYQEIAKSQLSEAELKGGRVS